MKEYKIRYIRDNWYILVTQGEKAAVVGPHYNRETAEKVMAKLQGASQ